ncbi:beta-xylosidase, partial [Streptomyces microflavus]
VTLNGTEQNMTGALNTVTVKDYRGGSTGWTLTGAVTDFSNGAGGTIAAEKFSWTPKITPGEGSPSQAVAGSTGPIGKTGATLASAPNADVTGGTFKADAGLSLAVPAYQAPGNYSATLTLSIS